MEKNIIVEEVKFNDIPCSIYHDDVEEVKPLIFFFHGFGGDHLNGILNKGHKLAAMGYYVVAMDAYLHGTRATEEFKCLEYAKRQKQIVDIEIQTAKDAKDIYNQYFKNNKLVKPNQVYAMGVSMGAGISFYLGTILDELKVIISIVGSPSFVEFYKYKQVKYEFEENDEYFNRLKEYEIHDPLINNSPLLSKYIYMGCGIQDEVVPRRYAKELCTKLEPNMYLYEEYECGHTSTDEMLEHAYNFLNEKSA